MISTSKKDILFHRSLFLIMIYKGLKFSITLAIEASIYNRKMIYFETARKLLSRSARSSALTQRWSSFWIDTVRHLVYVDNKNEIVLFFPSIFTSMLPTCSVKNSMAVLNIYFLSLSFKIVWSYLVLVILSWMAEIISLNS